MNALHGELPKFKENWPGADLGRRCVLPCVYLLRKRIRPCGKATKSGVAELVLYTIFYNGCTDFFLFPLPLFLFPLSKRGFAHGPYKESHTIGLRANMESSPTGSRYEQRKPKAGGTGALHE